MTQAHLNVKIDIQCTGQYSSHVIFLGVVGNHCFNGVSPKHTKLAYCMKQKIQTKNVTSSGD